MIAKQLGEESWIVRFYDMPSGGILYSNAGVITVSDSSGTRKEKVRSDPPVVTVGEGDILTFIRIEGHYSGSIPFPEAILQTIDQVVSSIAKY